jgi:hypothetical protein
MFDHLRVFYQEIILDRDCDEYLPSCHYPHEDIS